MQQQRSSLELRIENRANRVAAARRWARRSTYALFACGLAAIWQEPALSPPVHNGMVIVADTTIDWIYDSENSGIATAMSSFGGGGANASEFGPITDALLKLRN